MPRLPWRKWHGAHFCPGAPPRRVVEQARLRARRGRGEGGECTEPLQRPETAVLPGTGGASPNSHLMWGGPVLPTPAQVQILQGLCADQGGGQGICPLPSGYTPGCTAQQAAWALATLLSEKQHFPVHTAPFRVTHRQALGSAGPS